MPSKTDLTKDDDTKVLIITGGLRMGHGKQERHVPFTHGGSFIAAPFHQSLKLPACFHKVYPLVVLQRVEAGFDHVPGPLPQVWLRFLLELLGLLFVLLSTAGVVGRASGRSLFKDFLVC